MDKCEKAYRYMRIYAIYSPKLVGVAGCKWGTWYIEHNITKTSQNHTCSQCCINQEYKKQHPSLFAIYI